MINQENNLRRLLLEESQKIQSINQASHPLQVKFSEVNGFIIDTVPAGIMSKISGDVNTVNIDSDDFTYSTLAGNIQKETKLDKFKELEDYLSRIADTYSNYFPTFGKEFAKKLKSNNVNQKLPLVLTDIWVNHQKKHEFNPVHNHHGLFSFVIWVEIPFTLEEEIRQSPCRRLDEFNEAGCFEFLIPSYTDSGISKLVIRADKRYEGKMVFFPAHLHHLVYPFYSSDEYRISVAGNLFYKD